MREKLKIYLRFVLGVSNPYDYIILGRMLANGKRNKLAKYIFDRIGQKYHLEIPNFKNIGENLALGHPSGITVNPRAVIGKNCMLCKNSTIGSVRSGRREGVPKIGDNCVIGIGSFVCGGIEIGNDVLVCANAFVDFDVPDHSIVLGNPGVIHAKNNATVDYSKAKRF